MGQFIGYENIIRNFIKRINDSTLSHAHLIVGEDGIGKSKLAQIFATKILGEEEDKQYIDIIHYKPKKVSFGVDEVREIIEEVNKKPFQGDKKVIIIHDGNKLTIQAQNALLKTIEEPPSGVFIIILCESLELVLDTIKSRCQIYKLTPLSKEEIIHYINSINDNLLNEQLTAAVAYSEGVPGKAERFLNDLELKNLRDLILEVLSNLKVNDPEILLGFEEKLVSYKENKEDILNILASFIRDIMIYKEIDNTSIITNGDKIEDIQKLAINMSYKKLNNIIDKIREARSNLVSNSNFAATIRIMLIGFMEG